MRKFLKIIAFAAGLAASVTAPLAQEPYMPSGRPVSLVMGTGPGGSYDLYGRLIATHLARFIPGNPTIIVEHMPGAAGAITTNQTKIYSRKFHEYIPA
jgi:tripartite-type tricarboxylate transporter receptor subunit TctC